MKTVLLKVPQDQEASSGVNVGGEQFNFQDSPTHGGKVVEVTPGHLDALMPLGYLPVAGEVAAQESQAPSTALEATTPLAKAKKPV